MKISSNLTLELSDKPFLLEKRITLLKAIDEHGSLSKACKAVPISYKAAWDAIDSMNNLSSNPVVIRQTGGKGGGGSSLTEYGKKILHSYEIIKDEQNRFLNRLNEIAHIDLEMLNNVKRFAMQISARNQIIGIIQEIQKDEVNTNIKFKAKSNCSLFSNISSNSAIDLNLNEGDEVVAIFKSSNVILSKTAVAISARNKLQGVIEDIIFSNTNAQVNIDIGSDKITSVITKNSFLEMDLCIGDNVYAYVKSNDILIGI
ncbi:MAG: Molybdenum-pterin-binding protein MopA [Arcobacter lacus]|nr:MAG: Molybdenum-pterin-binding protein MopA [Arcobacter lacus]